jgi:hypothetical protein
MRCARSWPGHNRSWDISHESLMVAGPWLLTRRRRFRPLLWANDTPASAIRCSTQQTVGNSLDPSLTLTRTQYPATVSNTGNREPVFYVGLANPCNPQ